MSDISTSVFGAPADLATLEAYMEAGVDRALLPLTSTSESEVLYRLDHYAKVLDTF
jgi:hypothetical protein